MIVDIDAGTLQDGETVTISAGASAGGASLVFLTGNAQLAEAAGPVSVHTRIKGGSGGALTYSLSGVAGSADLAAVTAADKYFIINNMSAEFTAAIKANTPATVAIVAPKSWGSATTTTIGSLGGGKVVVQHRGKWYATASGGATATLAASPAASLPAAIAATTVTNTTAIINLQLDEIYDMYRVFTATATIVDAGGVDTDNKSSVVDISVVNNAASGAGTLVAISATALNGATLYLTGVTAFTQANNATPFSATTNLTGSPTLKSGTYAPNAAYSNAAGDTFFKVTGDNAGAVQIIRQ